MNQPMRSTIWPSRTLMRPTEQALAMDEFADFPHHDAVADAEACAAIIIHAADRYGAIDVPELTVKSGVRISLISQPPAAAIA